MGIFFLVGSPTAGWRILQGRNALVEPRLDSTINLILKVGYHLRVLYEIVHLLLGQALCRVLFNVLRQFFTIHGRFGGNLAFNRYLLGCAVILDVATTLIAILLCRSVAYIHIAIDVKESLVGLLVYAILHVLFICKGIAIYAVIEADGWRIGIYRREDKTVLTVNIGSVTALIEYITFSRNIACRSAIGIGEVDIMILLSFQLHRFLITTDYQSPVKVIANFVVSALAYIE